LIKRICDDKAFNISENEIDELLRAEQFTGRAKEQTEEFLPEVKVILEANKKLLGAEINITV
jgi:adenylosuccinate lyase